MDAVKGQLRNVSNQLKNVLSKQYLIIFIITLFFILLAIYTYRRFVSSKINPSYVANNEYISGGKKQTADVADLYYFYTTWCPHCKKSMPIWQELKSDIGDNKFKGYRINFIEVDCDKDKATADKFNVQGYPTIKLVKGNSITDFDARPSKDTLIEFLNSSL